MTNPWIPAPVGAVWAALFVGVVLIHLRHAAASAGRDRLRHLVHVLMAAGMAVMFLPATPVVVPGEVGAAVFAAAALVLVAARARRVSARSLPLLSVLDLAWMAYMFAAMNTQVAWLSVLGAVWFGARAMGGAAGWSGRVPARRGPGLGADPGPLVVRVTPTVMGLGMAYMLLAMTFGMVAPMSGMQGMPGM